MRIVRIAEQLPEKFVDIAVQELAQGKGLVSPTDTVYGFLADATNASAIEKIFLMKGREKGKPIPIFVSSIEMAKSLARIDKRKERFLKKVWPGKVTVVLPSKDVLPRELGSAKTIGLRIPNHDFVLKLLEKFGKPLTGTSANLSGELPLSDSKEVIAQFENRRYQPDLVIDAGRLPKARPSKVVDITGRRYKILRK